MTVLLQVSTANQGVPTRQTSPPTEIQCEALIEYDGLVAIQMYDPDGQGPYAPPRTALPCPKAAVWEAILPPDVLICNAHDRQGCQHCDHLARTLLFCGRCVAAFTSEDLGRMTIRRL